MSAPETYRRHAQPLSEAEQALWDRPAAPESLVEQLAQALCASDYDGPAWLSFADEPAVRESYLRIAAVAVEHLTGRAS